MAAAANPVAEWEAEKVSGESGGRRRCPREEKGEGDPDPVFLEL